MYSGINDINTFGDECFNPNSNIDVANSGSKFLGNAVSNNLKSSFETPDNISLLSIFFFFFELTGLLSLSEN